MGSHEMEQEAIVASVGRHTPTPGTFTTPFDGVELFRVVEPIKRIPGVYSPCLCVIVAGEKRAHVNGRSFAYNEEHYLCATMPTSVLAEVPRASAESPLLGLLMRLDTREMSRLVLDVQASQGKAPKRQGKPSEGFGVVLRDEGFDAALARLLALLDDPTAAQVLGPGRLRELLFAMLRGEAGDRLSRDFGGAPALAATLNYVHTHLGEEFSIDALAQRAGMSRAVFDRQFKTATSLSPLQYIKTLRLSEASMRIARGESVGDAARDVGYHSSSQFSREFRRQFGASPREWAQSIQV